MATIIVSSSVWYRVYEYYDNVETKYPNTWDINDTIEQINKIQWVINNFEHVCVWSREPIISYWRRMEWKETWHKSSPWHFAFECKCVNEKDFIFIQDAEHQDDIKENCLKDKSIITENKLYNTMNNTRNSLKLTESQLRNVIKESVKKVLNEDFVPYKFGSYPYFCHIEGDIILSSDDYLYFRRHLNGEIRGRLATKEEIYYNKDERSAFLDTPMY
jgi:hypothetical protein